jgi:hypothetical protein
MKQVAISGPLASTMASTVIAANALGIEQVQRALHQVAQGAVGQRRAAGCGDGQCGIGCRVEHVDEGGFHRVFLGKARASSMQTATPENFGRHPTVAFQWFA